MNFEFATASRIIFGAGKSSQIPALWRSLGEKPYFLLGGSAAANPALKEILKDHESSIISSEPTINRIGEVVQRIKSVGSNVIVSIGGGSVIDTGKAAAALAPNPGSVLDYLEVIGSGRRLDQDPLPLIAVPTTAGTGSEVTKNAVIASPEHRVKVSLRDPRMFPAAAVVDPALTYSLPPAVTACSGLDALTQCLEPYVSRLSTPLTDPLCLEGIRLISRSLPRVYREGGEPRAREEMALASLFGGLALANAKLGAVHGFAGPLGGMYAAPHGAVCAALLAPVVEINLRALSQREPGNPALARYRRVGRLVLGKEAADERDLVRWAAELVRDLGIPRLAEFGLRRSDFPELIEKGKASSSMKGNPIQLTGPELEEILERAL